MLKYAKVTNTETNAVSIAENATQWIISQGYTKKEVEQSDITGGWYLMGFAPMKSDEEKEKEERERLDNLSMTRGDVFEALILAKGLGKAQLRTMIENAELEATTKLLYLNRFDEALEFYRGYPIFDLLGAQLDITPQMLDEFFETKDYTKLIKVEDDLNSGETSNKDIENKTNIDTQAEKPIEGDTALVEPEESEEKDE